MKTSTNSNSNEDSSKIGQNKTTKKTTKARTKTSKTENKSAGTPSSGGGVSGGVLGNIAASNNSNPSNNNSSPTVATATVLPCTPRSTTMTSGNAYEAASAIAASNNHSSNTESSSSSRSHHKNYAGFEPRSVKIIWEQHDQGDVELSSEVCARVAEDASYKLWEMINNVKTYARHSGGVVTYDLVNEVLRDADVAPSLGAMDSDWDRIDYDGSYFFYSDKVIELRDEYQEDVTITMPAGPDLVCAWPVESTSMEFLKKYIPSIIYVSLYGDNKALDEVLTNVAFSPTIGSCYRVLLAKIIQILAFKQNDPISVRCWSLLRALAFNPRTRDVDCREEYYHLAEILICQLMAPYETIKVHSLKVEPQKAATQDSTTIKMEADDDDVVKVELDHEVKNEFTDEEMFNTQTELKEEEKIYKLEPDDDNDDFGIDVHKDAAPIMSAYFASPVDWQHVDELCQTIGQLAAPSGFFHSECLFHILRRLERFFDGRNVSTERDYNYISRAIRGLLCLGEYAFREFIPFAYKFNAEKMPANLWKDFAPAAIFIKGSDDIFLYEWLEFLCGADRLQPFLIYYAQYHEKLLTYRFLHRKLSTYKICPKVTVRRLEWSTLAAAMCHGDDPNKALKPKPAINDYFPELTAPNLNLNRAGTIRFKFAGCRPVIIKPKACQQLKPILKTETTHRTEISTATTTAAASAQKDILIARRKLLKPLTNERRVLPLSSYYFARI